MSIGSVDSKTLSNCESDYAGNFLNGVTDAALNGASNIIASTTAPVGAITGTLISAAQIATIATTLTTEAVTYITENVTSYAADQTAKMLSIDLSKVMGKAGEMMQKYLMSSGDILEMLNSDAEDQDEKQAQEDLKNAQNETVKAINDKVGTITSAIDKKLSKVTDGIQSITAYITKGEDWLSENITKYQDTAVNESKKFLAQMANDIEEQKNVFYERMAEPVAKKTAETTNNALIKESKKDLDKIKEAKQRAINIAKVIVKSVLLKLKGMLGG